MAGSITPDQANPPVGSNVTWTAVNGFGPGKVEYYRYAWDTSPTHTWTDTETQWSGGTLATAPTSAGAWYLHVKGYNGAAVGNGTFDYSVTAGVVYSQTNAVSSMVDHGNGTFTLSFVGTPEAQYYVVTSTDPVALAPAWAALAKQHQHRAASERGVVGYGDQRYRAAVLSLSGGRSQSVTIRTGPGRQLRFPSRRPLRRRREELLCLHYFALPE